MLKLWYVISVALVVSASTSGCTLRLSIDGGASAFSFTGVGDSDLLRNIELTPGFENQRIGLTGSLTFDFDGRCPSTRQHLHRALSSRTAKLYGNSDLRLYPSNVTVLASIFARLDFVDLGFEYQWDDLRTSNGGQIESDTVMGVVRGSMEYAVDPSLGFDVEPGAVSLQNLTSTQTQTATLSVATSIMSLEIPDARFTFTTEFETGVDVLPRIEATVNLTGSIFATGSIDCSDFDCGKNGRCLALDSGENQCQCGCGWTGDDCDIPSGFCDPYAINSKEVETPSIQQLPSSESREQQSPDDNSLEVQCESFLNSRRCPDSRSVYDTNSEQCTCVPGWQGRDCDVCKPGRACIDFFEDGTACIDDAVYQTRSGKKIYECDLRNTGFDAFIGNSVKFECNTTGPRFSDLDFQTELRRNPSISPVGNTPFCRVDFTIQDSAPVKCTAWGCRFRPGATNVACDQMECTCDNCGAVQSIVDGITGAKLDCDSQNRCEVFFSGLSITIAAPCIIGECLLPSNPDFKVPFSDDSGFKFNSDVFIISMPVVFVAALCLIFGIPVRTISECLSNRTNKGSEEMSKAQSDIRSSAGAEISFVDVHCEVPVSSVPHGTAEQRDSSILTATVKDPDQSSIEWLPEALSSLESISRAAPGFRSVLHRISGTVERGHLMGVVGPTGSGKTTFLSTICNVSGDRATRRNVTGHIVVNGRKSGRWMKRLVAFVPQDDLLIATLTVRESLLYSALLRKPGCAAADIECKVEQVLTELSLWNVEHSQVGGVRNRRGISGGERRRVTIGMEMVTDPDLIIMDEPTSGLDSFAALNLLRTLKTICNGGRTVILSVHQPTPVMLDMLDQVLLLARGFQIYLGPPSEAPAFFERHGVGMRNSRGNIAEHMLQTVSTVDGLVSILNSIHATPETTDKTHQFFAKDIRTPHVAQPRQSTIFALKILIWRGFLDIIRNPALFQAHVVVAIGIGIFCGGIFFDTTLDIEGAQNRLGGAFFVLAFLGFWSLTTVDLLHVERGIVAREISSGYYSPYIYLTSKIALDAVLLRIIPAILISLPLYFMMNLQLTAEKFSIFLLTVATFNLIVGLIAMTVTLLSPTAGTASLLINTVLLVGLLFAGHLVNIPSMPKVVRWLHHLSPFHYGFQILAVNEMVGLQLTFVVAGLADVEGIGGDVFLRTVGIEDANITNNLISLVASYAIALTLTYICMWLSRQHRTIVNYLTSQSDYRPRHLCQNSHKP